jgi:hypothetical protein
VGTERCCLPAGKEGKTSGDRQRGNVPPRGGGGSSGPNAAARGGTYENSELRALIFRADGSKGKDKGNQRTIRRARSTTDSFGAPPPFPPPAKAIFVR